MMGASVNLLTGRWKFGVQEMKAVVTRRRTAGLGTVIALLLAAGAHSQAQTGVKRVRVSIPGANVTYLPFYAAKEKGYYKDAGEHSRPAS
jgi:hypothetical protein